jgi:fluoroquinolone transport system permease protein
VSNLQVLVRGEFARLSKYNLFTANFVVLLFWVLLTYFLEGAVLLRFIPLIFFMDSVMMTILLVGATLFYEKKEHTINSIMVSPVTEDEYLISKIVVNAFNSLITVVFVSVAVYVIKGVTFNYFLVVPAVVMVTALHTVIGIRLSYTAKDFTSLIINYMVYVFVFVMPPLFAMVDLIDESIARFFILLPPEASNLLISSAFVEVDPWRVMIAYVYLFALTAVLYYRVVKPGFNAYLIKETGV